MQLLRTLGAPAACKVRYLPITQINFVGARQQGLRQREPERLGRTQVEHHIEAARLFHRQIAGFRAAQDAIDLLRPRTRLS